MTGTVQSVGRAVHGSPGQFMHGPGATHEKVVCHDWSGIYMPCHIRYEYSTGFILYIFRHGWAQEPLLLLLLFPPQLFPGGEGRRGVVLEGDCIL